MSDATNPSAPAPRRRRLRLAGLGDLPGLLGALLLLILVFGLASRNFWTWRTLQSIVNQVPDLVVVAVGMTAVVIAGGIDLSVGSVLALSGSVLGIAMTHWGWPIGPAAMLALAVGAGCGLVNGSICAAWRVPSFIVTLGMLEVARGLAYRITDSQTQYIGKPVEWLARPIARVGVSPAFLTCVAVVLAGQILLSRTVWGRHLVAVGSNEPAARLSGLATRRIRLATFVIAGTLAAAGAVFQVARLSTADPNGGIGLELAAIAAVVIGGTSLMGGEGSVVRSFLGVLVVAVLQAGLAQVGASEPTKRVITGSVIVLAVIADLHRRGRTAGGSC